VASRSLRNSAMSLNYPTPPSGSNNEANYHRRLLDCLKRSFPRAGVGLVMKETPTGVILSLAQQGSFASANGSATYLFAVTQLLGKDYLMAKFWNGSSLGKEIAIAKHFPFRFKNSERIDDIDFNYTRITSYSFDPTGDNNRTASDGSTTQREVVFPRYVTMDSLSIVNPNGVNGYQCLILATQLGAGTGVTTDEGQKIIWQELPGRVWSRRYNQ